MRRYDVVIIGAGPSGLMATRTLLKLNPHLDILLIDKRRNYDQYLGPTYIKKYTFQRLMSHLLDDKRIDNFNSFKFLKEFDEIDIKLDDSVKTLSIPYYRINASQYAEWLQKPIKEKLKLRTDIKHIIRARGFVTLVTSRNTTINAKLAIIASGNINNDLIAGKRHDSSKRTAMIPMLFKEQNKRLVLDYSEVDLPSRRMVGMPRRSYESRILFCGTAAGLWHPFTGESLGYALESGKIAAMIMDEAIRKNRYSKNQMMKYEKRWKESFEMELASGESFANILMTAKRNNILQSFFESIGRKDIHRMILQGKLPLRIRLAVLLIGIFGRFRKDSLFCKLIIRAIK